MQPVNYQEFETTGTFMFNSIQYTYRNKMIVGNENKEVPFNIVQDTFIYDFQWQLFQTHS